MGMSRGNYMSLDPVTAMSGVQSDMDAQELRQVVYSARCGAARRIALSRLDDQTMFAICAKEDPDPMVRRGCCRRLEDADILREICDSDGDCSVRGAAQWALERLTKRL